MSGRRIYWAMVCGDKIYGPFPSEKEVKYFLMVIHMAGAVRCKEGKLGKWHQASQMIRD